MTEILTFDRGCYCEDYPWEIRLNSVEDYYEKIVCKHAREITSSDPEWPVGFLTKYDQPGKRRVVVPRVVVAFNEAKHNSTVVCLDCIMEAAKKL